MSSNVTYSGPHALPPVLPVFPLSGALLLPRAQMPLNIFEPRYMAMIDYAMATNRLIGMVQPNETGNQSPVDDLCLTGCVGRITALMETGDNRYLITLTGIARFHIVEEVEGPHPFRNCRISAKPFEADFEPGPTSYFNRERLLDTLRAYLEANDLEVDWEEIDQADDEMLVNSLAMAAPYGTREKQALLEAPDMAGRAELLIAITERHLGAGSDDGTTRLQ